MPSGREGEGGKEFSTADMQSPTGVMTRADLAELVARGEGSSLEFRRDDLTAECLAGEMAALFNLGRGHILLGVEDDGSVSGLARPAAKAEEWVMEAARTHVQPAAAIPLWRTIRWDEDRVVGVVSVPPNPPDKPYKAKRRGAWVTRVRVGTTTRDASREEEQRLYQRSGALRYGAKPVLGSTLESLDRRRLTDYFGTVLAGEAPPEDDDEAWAVLLRNLEFLTLALGTLTATVDGMLLFGTDPRRRMHQAGIHALAFPGEDMDYATREDRTHGGPMTPRLASDGEVMESGLVERAIEFVRRNTMPTARLENGRVVRGWEYPEAVVREAVVNALVHRDYGIAGSDIELLVFSNRLEVRSPGGLPNTVTPEAMRRGMRCARDQVLVNVMRDYGYVDGHGMGISRKIVPGMRKHNGTEPELIEEGERFTVRLWKEPPAAPRRS